MRREILKGYADAAADLAERFERFTTEEVLAPVEAYLPKAPSRILDIGAGTGRDAAWFTAAGHDVVAVEPVDAFRAAGAARHKPSSLTWLDDTLPRLTRTVALGQRFDLILLSAVWHHLDDTERAQAMPILAGLLSPKGRLVLSIRHGEGAPMRYAYPVRVSDTIASAQAAGLSHIAEIEAPSVQTENRNAGVSWTWLVLEAPRGT